MKVIIELARKEEFKEQLNKLNKFADKHGFTPLVVSEETNTTMMKEVIIGTRDGCSIDVEEVRHTEVPAIKIILTGDLPVFNGYKIVAKVMQKDGQIISTDANYTPTELVCEHCRKNRDRQTTYIVEKDGQTKQIASSCVKHYVGSDIGKFFTQIVLFKAFIQNLDEEHEAVYCKHADHLLDRVAQQTNMAPDQILTHFRSREDKFKEIRTFYAQTAQIVPGTEKLITGLLYDSANAIQQEAQQKADKGHIGTIGERLTLKVDQVIKQFFYQDRYDFRNCYWINTIATEQGVVSFFSSKEIPLKEGETFKGTVKKHGEFQGVKQTTLNRVMKVK